MANKIVAIIGTYRKEGTIDMTVGAILDAAKQAGAQTEKIYLIDKHIEFCTNCRACTQEEGEEHGTCLTDDDMNSILDTIDESDCIILASPMNFSTVTAVMKRFIERLVCYAYWPWPKGAPTMRKRIRNKKAVLVISSAAPRWLSIVATRIVGLMKKVAGILGAKTVGVLFIGLAGGKTGEKLSKRARKKAERLGRELAEESMGSRGEEDKMHNLQTWRNEAGDGDGHA